MMEAVASKLATALAAYSSFAAAFCMLRFICSGEDPAEEDKWFLRAILLATFALSLAILSAAIEAK